MLYPYSGRRFWINPYVTNRLVIIHIKRERLILLGVVGVSSTDFHISAVYWLRSLVPTFTYFQVDPTDVLLF